MSAALAPGLTRGLILVCGRTASGKNSYAQEIVEHLRLDNRPATRVDIRSASDAEFALSLARGKVIVVASLHAASPGAGIARLAHLIPAEVRQDVPQVLRAVAMTSRYTQARSDSHAFLRDFAVLEPHVIERISDAEFVNGYCASLPDSVANQVANHPDDLYDLYPVVEKVAATGGTTDEV